MESTVRIGLLGGYCILCFGRGIFAIIEIGGRGMISMGLMVCLPFLERGYGR